MLLPMPRIHQTGYAMQMISKAHGDERIRDVESYPDWAGGISKAVVDEPGPVLYRARRVGHGGREFDMYKFRSMYVDAEARLAGLRHLNEHDGVLFKIRDDPRGDVDVSTGDERDDNANRL